MSVREKTTGKQASKNNRRREPVSVDRSVLAWCSFSCFAVWLSFPPAGLWPIAWIGIWGWLKVLRNPSLPGKRPWVTVYLTSYVHWLALTYWVTLPHYSAAIGWFFLAAYLAVYTCGFVVLARWLVHRARWPMEVIRSSNFILLVIALVLSIAPRSEAQLHLPVSH